MSISARSARRDRPARRRIQCCTSSTLIVVEDELYSTCDVQVNYSSPRVLRAFIIWLLIRPCLWIQRRSLSGTQPCAGPPPLTLSLHPVCEQPFAPCATRRGIVSANKQKRSNVTFYVLFNGAVSFTPQPLWFSSSRPGGDRVLLHVRLHLRDLHLIAVEDARRERRAAFCGVEDVGEVRGLSRA